MLTAGGTGGHLFPAFSLAQELTRRGWEIDLITDMRGHRYGADFPARETYRVPAATLAGKKSCCDCQNPDQAWQWHGESALYFEKDQSIRDCRLWRLPNISSPICRQISWHPSGST